MNAKEESNAADWLMGRGEMAELIRSMDWSATPLGAREAWPQTLRTVVNLILSGSFPKAILWGSDLIFIYNDAYRVIADDRHPEAMGRSTRDVWPEAWEFNKPIFERVMARGEPVYLEDQRFHIARHGAMEDTYFTLSYSPIHTETGQVGGTLVTLLETTWRVCVERQLQQANEGLEKRIAERTADLTATVTALQAEVNGRIRAEQVLNASERKYRMLHDTMTDAFVAVGMDGRIREFNKTYPYMLGYEAQELYGLTYGDITPPRWHELEAEIVRTQILPRGSSEVYSKEYRRKDGSIFPVELRTFLLRDEAGKPEGMWAIVRNITERKRVEDALQESEQRYRSLVDNIGLGVTLIGPDFRIRSVNAAQVALFDKAAQDLVGKKCFWEFEKRQAVCPGCPGKVAMATARPAEGERVGVRDDGRTTMARVQAFPMLDSSGCATGFIEVVEDITERRRAAEQHSTILKTTMDGFWLIDSRGRILEVNDAMCRMNGYSREELLEMSITDLEVLETPEETAEHIRQVMAAGQARFEAQHRCKDGRIIDIELSITYMGEPWAQLFCFIRDITERKRVEQELTTTNLSLEHSTSRLRALALELTHVEQQERRRLAGVLHDHLQQILVAAKLNLATVAMGPLEAIQRDPAQKAAVAIDEALAQTRSLTVELSPPVLREGGLGIALKWLAERMRQTHGLEVEADVQDDGMRIDESFRIVLFNAVRELLLNVLKHAKVSSATVEMLMLPDDHVRIVVADRGCGFADSPHGSAHNGGDGFGLLAIRERVESLGGTMEIESRPGQGSRITLTAPIGPSVAPREAPQPDSPKVHVAGTVRPEIIGDAGGKGIRVLLVDDHAMVRQAMAQLLSAVPEIVVVAEASDGKEAVHLTRELRPDVVVMDVNMPKMGGVAATRAIHAEWPEVAIIGLSMYQESHRVEEMRQAGAVGYVSKSEVTEKLIAAIQACRKE